MLILSIGVAIISNTGAELLECHLTQRSID